MDRLQVRNESNLILITLPDEFRNENWSEDFGEVQQLLRQSKLTVEVVINLSQCTWVDPLPVLSLAIALFELPKHIRKKVYLASPAFGNPEQFKVMAFLEKEGFLDCFSIAGADLLVLQDDGSSFIYEEIDRSYYLQYQNLLKYADSSIFPAIVVDLKQIVAHQQTIENWISKQLQEIRHRIISKVAGTLENEIFSKLSLFLKETVENIYEHAYDQDVECKPAAVYVRFRRGLGDNSLEFTARNDLRRAIEKEHNCCPTLRKGYVEKISSFIEAFVLDAGNGLSFNYYKDKHYPKYPFREAWRQTIGLGQRGANSPAKNTRFGGLYTISRVLENNYLSARDQNEWIGDELPIRGSSEQYDANQSYLIIASKHQLSGLALIGRISWQVASDENPSWYRIFDHLRKTPDRFHPIRDALLEEKDVYIKYFSTHFSRFSANPLYIKDHKYGYTDERLKKKYFEQIKNSNFCLYLPPEGLTKNVIYDTLVNDFLDTPNSSKCIIIGDISVPDTGLYQIALENARFPDTFLNKVDKIVLISRRLRVFILIKTKNTFINTKSDQIEFLNSNPLKFSPNISLKHYIEWLKTHDSLIFWRYLEKNNLLNEYYLKSEVDWYQGDQTIMLRGYLNFAKTLTDNFCVKMYENALERTLALANNHGCHYESIDILTTRLCQHFNSIFYNKASSNSRQILLGSVYVSGYSERAARLLLGESDSRSLKIHFFYNTNTVLDRSPRNVMQLFLWPVRGVEWFETNISKNLITENKGKYRRIGATHVIAPSGWKYFPIPRYKLINKITKRFIDNYKLSDINNPENFFISIYKCPPNDTYLYWQGKKNEVVSYGHMVYENNHELFKIDFLYIINESFKLGDELAQFLLGEFLIALSCTVDDALLYDNDRLKNGVVNYIGREQTFFKKDIWDCAVIVYPYHYHTDHAIKKIKSFLPAHFHDRIIALFPVTKERTASTFLPSPLTMEAINARIEEYKLLNPEKQINVMLFDDSTISGKTRSDINHILFSLNVKNVKTVSIVERTRLPFSTSYPYRHKAFWRLDIPKLGTSDNCPICNVLSDITEFQKSVVSDNAQARLDGWKLIWKKTSPFDGNDSKPITPVLLNLVQESRKKKFGIYYNGYKHEQCGGDDNKIEIINSLGLSIYTAELHSMTSRDDIILEYYNNAQIPNTVKLEMLCTNLLLFGNEISKVILHECVKYIYQLSEQMDVTNLTSYAALTLLAQSKESIEALFKVIKDPMESDITVSNYDMLLVLSRISTNPHSKFSFSNRLNRIHKGFKNLSTLYKQFHSELFNDFGKAHDTPLHLILNEDVYDLKTIYGVKDSCDKLIFLLNELPQWYLRKDNSESVFDYEGKKLAAISDLGVIKDKINALIQIDETEKIIEVRALIRKVINDTLYFHRQLFLCIQGPGQENFKKAISDLIELKEIEDVAISEDFKIITPLGQQYNRWIVWDRDTIREIAYILTNARHAQGAWCDPQSDSEILKNAWVHVKLTETQCHLIMLNKSKINADIIKERTKLREKPEKLHLKELKIDIIYTDLIINTQKVVETKIIIPFINTY